MTGIDQRELPTEYARILPIWDRMARRLMIAYTAAGATSIACSLFVSAYTGHLHEEVIRVAAFGGSMLLSLIAAFNLGAKANAARNAWRLLHAASVRYRHDSTYTFSELHAQYVAGELLIGDITFNGTDTQPKR